MLHPGIEVAQRLLHHPKVTDSARRILMFGVQRMVHIPEPEVIVGALVQMFPHPGAIPIGLPRESLAIPQRFDHDHVASKPA